MRGATPGFGRGEWLLTSGSKVAGGPATSGINRLSAARDAPSSPLAPAERLTRSLSRGRLAAVRAAGSTLGRVLWGGALGCKVILRGRTLGLSGLPRWRGHASQ
ncbi:hypothetical protein B0H10DRAFT_2236698 [Mycena sp. CBHHK59/15]|nr:hypothetical protein B0H10DRAFT_2236698 [Mycena sp. CBHHK59/15]